MSDTANLYRKIFPILHNGAERIPTIDGMYETELMAEDFQQGSFFIALYSASGHLIATPPEGATFTLQLSPIEGQWHALNENGVISSNTITPLATYIIPTFCTLVRKARIMVNGATAFSNTNVDHIRAFVWRGITA